MRSSCKDLKNEIVSYNDGESIRKLLANENKETLVMFDASGVLIDSDNTLFAIKKSNYIKDLLNQRVGSEKAKYLISILTRDSKYKVIESAIKDLVYDLQSRDVKALALSACITGKFGVIESMDDFHVAQLKGLGYNFKKSWQNLEPTQLNILSNNHPMKNSNISYPSFKDGVICTDRGDKSKALSDFLGYANFRPKKIVFTDNKMKYLLSFADMAREECIEFFGIEYTHAMPERNATPV